MLTNYSSSIIQHIINIFISKHFIWWNLEMQFQSTRGWGNSEVCFLNKLYLKTWTLAASNMKEKTYSNQILISWVEFKATIYRYQKIDQRRVNKTVTFHDSNCEQAPTGHRSSTPLPNKLSLNASWYSLKLSFNLSLKLSRTL